MKKSILTSSIILATTLHYSAEVFADIHKESSGDFVHTQEDLNRLNLSSLAILDDNIFVFNNDLATRDWDNIFASYMPTLSEYKETIMHYAGYYSINPKVLISLIELKSKAVSSPSKKRLNRPFGNLSDKTGFAQQTKDVAHKLAKRFYGFKKMEQDIKNSKDNALTKVVPTSASTVALMSLLASDKPLKPTKMKGIETRPLDKKTPTIKEKKIDLFSLLHTYEDIFVESKDFLLKKQAVPMGKAPQISLAAKASGAALPTMYLPWTSGWSWRATGAHGYDGNSWPLSSLDFYYPYGNTGWGGNKPYVYAAHAGTVTWLSRCQMRITHPSGIATNYYHMDNLQYSSGSYIYAGTYIGTYANTRSASLCEGGQSTGPHLHMSLIKNGYWESLQGYSFSGYYVQVGTTQYDSNCNRSYLWKNGTTYCPGNDIYKPYE